jgi:hypothetical protein
LAGALGRPTMLFVPQSGGRLWYWFSDRTDSPWYARMRVTRQRVGQSWKELVSGAAEEIAALARATHAGA